MNHSNFVKVKHQSGKGYRHFVVPMDGPGFSIEFSEESNEKEKLIGGMIKKVCFPNSWTGNYHQYGKLFEAAQAFFVVSQEMEEQVEPSSRL
ncbi:MAG: hypothetical protein JKY51_02155 [Opitutaceae bacterium]|nr:hypothetical protein [Opitutaceae bacterium]